MKVHFFEEFPTKNSFIKAELIDFDSTVYVAARSLTQFRELKRELHEVNSRLEAAYWPILEKSYWISPFSYTSELESLIEDLYANRQDETQKMLIDLELPFLYRKLFLRNASSFSRNKRIIGQVFEKQEELNIRISTFEYPVSKKALEWVGLSYPTERYSHKKIIMFYSSFLGNGFVRNAAKKFIVRTSEECGGDLQVGLGTIAKGILGTEIILSPEHLDMDLNFLSTHKIQTAVIFRLEGLNKDYIEVIMKYLDC